MSTDSPSLRPRSPPIAVDSTDRVSLSFSGWIWPSTEVRFWNTVLISTVTLSALMGAGPQPGAVGGGRVDEGDVLGAEHRGGHDVPGVAGDRPQPGLVDRQRQPDLPGLGVTRVTRPISRPRNLTFAGAGAF